MCFNNTIFKIAGFFVSACQRTFPAVLRNFPVDDCVPLRLKILLKRYVY